MDREELRANFGMNDSLAHRLGGSAAIPALQELHTLKAWCSTPLQLDRPSHIKAHAKETMSKMEAEVRMYMGFLANYQELDSWDITLWQCCNPSHLAAYISFLRARRIAPLSVISYISNLRKVLVWLETLKPTTVEQAQLQRATQWLSHCSSQASAIGNSNNHNKEAKSRLPTCKEVLMFQNQVVAEADRLYNTAMASSTGLLVGDGKANMEAFMFCMMFGYHPPIRSSCLISLMHPDFPSTKCSDQGCNIDACLGNRLQYVPGSNKEKLEVFIPHHKNSTRGRDIAIHFTLSPSITPLALRYVKDYHPIISRGRPNMFFAPCLGSVMGPSNFSVWFKGLQSRFRVSWVTFAPYQLRHIFVTERMGSDAVQGPEPRACARVMGNSVQRWLKTYDINVSEREVAQCVADMKSWREALLDTE